MARHRKAFKTYSSAQAFVKKLNLKTMRDWINFSKGQDLQGRKRPSDIPSSPWLVYQDELKSQGKKFSINEFIGSAKATKVKAVAPKTAEVRTPSKQGIKAVATTEKPTLLNKAISYTQAKSTVRKMHARTRADYNALVRMKLLPKSFTENPARQFKDKWHSWDDFLGIKK